MIKFYVLHTRYHRVGRIFITFIYSLSVSRDIYQKIFNNFDLFRFVWKCFPYCRNPASVSYTFVSRSNTVLLRSRSRIWSKSAHWRGL